MFNKKMDIGFSDLIEYFSKEIEYKKWSWKTKKKASFSIVNFFLLKA